MFGSTADTAVGQAPHFGGTKVKVTRAEKNELVEQLRTFDIFAKCTRDDLDALVEHGKPFTLPANWVLIYEGAAADSFYAITRGDARVFHGRAEVAEVHAGEVIGESTLLVGIRRNATVTSTSRLKGLRVSADSVIDLFVHHPHVLEALRAAHEPGFGDDLDFIPEM